LLNVNLIRDMLESRSPIQRLAGFQSCRAFV
jgi:hypothetical protein